MDAGNHDYVATPVALRELPERPAGLAGRGDELDAVLAALAPGPHQTQTEGGLVCAPPGMGTSSLLLAAGHEALRRGWYHRAVYVDATGPTRVEPARLLDAVLRALDVPPAHIGTSLAERFGLYRTELGVAADLGQPVLVVVDQLTDVEQLGNLLPGPGGNCLLASASGPVPGTPTARVRQHYLDPLSVEDRERVLQAALRIAGTDDVRIATDSAGRRALAQACGGSPLAVRIAAALLEVETGTGPADIADELAERVAAWEETTVPAAAVAPTLDSDPTADSHVHRDCVLTGSDRSWPAREPELRACLSAACARLAADQAEALHMIARAPGVAISTRAVAALDGRSHGEILPLLRELARLHLVQPQQSGWLTMHPRVRSFARTQLGGVSDRRWAQAEGRLLRYYTRAAREAAVRSASGGGPAGMGAAPTDAPETTAQHAEEARAWLAAERRTLVAATLRARDTGHTDVAVQLPGHLARFLDDNRYVEDWVTIAEIASSSAVAAGEPRDVATALNHYAAALARASRTSEAITAYERACALLGELDLPTQEAWSRERLGAALLRTKEAERAAEELERSRELYQERGERFRQAACADRLGVALTRAQRTPEAVTAHREASDLFAELDRPANEAGARDRLGTALLRCGSAGAAVDHLRRARELYRTLGDATNESAVGERLGTALWRGASAADAATVLEETCTHYRTAGAGYREAVTRDRLGRVYTSMEYFERAMQAHRRACTLFAELGEAGREAAAQDRLGYVCSRLGHYDTAISAYQRAQHLFRELGDSPAVAACSNRLGSVLLTAHQYPEALAAHEVALAHLSVEREEPHRAVAAHGRGLALHHLGRRDEAIAAMEDARRGYAAVGDHAGAERAEESLRQLRQVIPQSWPTHTQDPGPCWSVARATFRAGRSCFSGGCPPCPRVGILPMRISGPCVGRETAGD
ncbi:tetratricopeptide repeat protein [Lipingzhangella sp. LS1_29]|uniref:Tetratricopeptide repeat protein n=1 Tax=Lipingzhangella rawalii TaxID=2055835 RepID=A0ABU2H8J2_9ACTN|nr:tetratricopeptide repeat protein [Lipingzhangella rawalii]MDS1271307.1 tetratricopeptide repeat protein [Lipingzhangella rawalii]